MSSWIKLHRESLSHWLYTEKRPLTRREAWENMLLLVNWEPGKVLIRGVLYECNRGESLYSLETWAKNFNWTIQQIRTFFKLLEKDNMIIVKGLQYTTKVTICNYDIWQGNDDKPNKRTTNEQQTANRPLTTIKESKESKESKEINISFDVFWNLYPTERKTKKTSCIEYWKSLTDEKRQFIIDNLPNYIKSVSDIKYLKLSYYFFKEKKYDDENFSVKKEIKPINILATFPH